MYVDYQVVLTPPQYEVVTQHDGPILCVACPGSGKTHTLVHRAAHMIQVGKIPPEQILLVSFTRKASHEIVSRIVKLIGNDAKGIWAGTFHSIALRLLRKHYTLLGFESPFSVMSQGDQTDLMRMVRERGKQCVGSGAKLPPVRELLSFYSAIRNKGLDMEEQAESEYAEFPEVIPWMYDNYRSEKSRMCLVDYDDLLFGLRYVLASKLNLRAIYSKKFKYIMVDEFQDTNAVQNELVLLLTDQHDNLMVVGDEAQSIYAFRGADITNILTIVDHFPGMTVMRLEENHRSNKHIVSLLNTTLQYATEKIDKTMRSVVNSEDIDTDIVPIMYTAQSGLDQAEYVTNTIMQLHNEKGVNYCDIAVLFRNSYHANLIDMFLSRQQIPFVRWGGIKFTEAAHVLDILAFLKIMINKYDRVSWRRLLTMIPGVGPSAAQKILNVILDEGEDQPLYASPSGVENAQPWKTLAGMLGKAKYVPFLRSLGTALCDIDLHDIQKAFDVIWAYYEPHCKRLYPKDFDFRQHGIGQLREMASQYATVVSFLDEFATEDVNDVNELDELSEDPEDSQGKKQKDKLVLSTIHSAKGCERKYVFVVELIEGALPSYRSSESEEELRLFYVACSRAKYGLYLIFPKTRQTQNGRTEKTTESRFLQRVKDRLDKQNRPSSPSLPF